MKMEVEKQGAKGGFFQLFDWHGKSRKKLLSSKSELPETSNQERENLYGSAIAHQRGHENGFSPDVISHKDYHYASSASGDSEYGTKAPGAVARLMGLDSLPISTANEPCSTPFIDSVSFRDSREHDIIIFKSVRNKLDGLIRNPLDLRLQKVRIQPIDKFQREVLPPKSAKPISTTHHRLLSPIKSPGFIPPKNAAYVIEAAAKIIEQNPRSATSAKLPSSSLPFRVQNMKKNMECNQRLSRSADASQKGKEPSSTKHAKKKLSARGQHRSEDGYVYMGSEESKGVDSQRSKSKGKPVSLAAQAKVNIQKRDGSSSVGNRSSDKQKEYNGIKRSSISRNVPNIQNKMEKQSLTRNPDEVLRLNHQKQNRASGNDQEILETSLSQLRDRKESNLYGRGNRTVNKIIIDNVTTSKKINLVAADPGKELSASRMKTNSKKKPPLHRNIQSDGSASQKAFVVKNKKSVKCVVAYESDSEWDTMDKKNSVEIVSFTFTSPIKKSGNSLPTNDDIYKGKQESQNTSDCPSIDKLWLKVEKQNEELDYIEKDGNNSTVDYQGRYLHLQGSGSVSSAPSISGASSCSFDVDGSLSNESSVQCLSLESCEGMTWNSTRTPHPPEGDTEISDTASSLSIGTISETVASSLYLTDSNEPFYWELQYITDILTNGELMSEEFALGQAHKIMAPNLFDQLEKRETGPNKVMEEHFMLERKLLFDCVNECLEARFGQLNSWARQSRLLHNKQYLAEELYREISSWTNNEESMVDEIMDKDMSCKNGKWTDFGFEVFEEGLEIERIILAVLVDEMIVDFFS